MLSYPELCGVLLGVNATDGLEFSSVNDIPCSVIVGPKKLSSFCLY